MSGCIPRDTGASITSLYAPKVQMSAWGLEVAIDLYNCDPLKIRDPKAIEDYVIELCHLIDMKRFGECRIVHFGDGDEKVAGYSMVQLIETSLISGHFANMTNNAYLNVFSCKLYHPALVVDFSKNYFLAEDFKFILNERR